MKYTQPGRLMHNGYIERFNRFFREDINIFLYHC
ncbi:integrase core domain-containing protein [Myroides odoratus]